ncbi:hypothetical protein FB451DRAFT_1561499 [Mycena latifolia]|nr:hypothetical protein FB451DRAFT_1568505 [Mycena latifolia]KAJ7465087.1 hypothetical protein FB451DRAFT_1561499 [Mycena latifolia]
MPIFFAQLLELVVAVTDATIHEDHALTILSATPIGTRVRQAAVAPHKFNTAVTLVQPPSWTRTDIAGLGRALRDGRFLLHGFGPLVILTQHKCLVETYDRLARRTRAELVL